jgi:MYXO-CTERM domain-containing protein
MKRSSVIAALCAASGGVSSAHATVFFTFDDPDTGLEVRHEQPSMGGDAFGTMTYAAGGSPTVDLVVDISDEPFAVGTGIHEFDAVLTWTNWEVSPVTDLGLIRTADVMGEFEFFDTASNEVIFSGSFSMGLVVESQGAGSVITATDSNLSYTPGPALTAIYPNLLFQSAWDGVYTLTDIQFDNPQQKIVNVNTASGADDFFGSFSANAAFTGTTQALVPTPGAAALTGLALLGAGSRRRRH